VAVDKIWSKNGIQIGQLAPAAVNADAVGFYDSIAKLSPNTEAQHFIQKRALMKSAEPSARHARSVGANGHLDPA